MFAGKRRPSELRRASPRRSDCHCRHCQRDRLGHLADVLGGCCEVGSSRAPHRPRNRRRSSVRMRLRCAKSISTALRSRRETSQSFSLRSARVRSRAPSWMDRMTLRAGWPGQHCSFSESRCSRSCPHGSGCCHRPAPGRSDCRSGAGAVWSRLSAAPVLPEGHQPQRPLTGALGRGCSAA